MDREGRFCFLLLMGEIIKCLCVLGVMQKNETQSVRHGLKRKEAQSVHDRAPGSRGGTQPAAPRGQVPRWAAGGTAGACAASPPVAAAFSVEGETRSSAKRENGGGGVESLGREKGVK